MSDKVDYIEIRKFKLDSFDSCKLTHEKALTESEQPLGIPYLCYEKARLRALLLSEKEPLRKQW